MTTTAPETTTAPDTTSVITAVPAPIALQHITTQSNAGSDLTISSVESSDTGITEWLTADDSVDYQYTFHEFSFHEFNISGGDNQGQDGETCPDAWLMILEGAPPTEPLKPILPKTCNANVNILLPELTILTNSRTATIYLKKNNGAGSFNVTRRLLVGIPFVDSPTDLTEMKTDSNLTISSVDYAGSDTGISAWQTAAKQAPRVNYLFDFHEFNVPGGDNEVGRSDPRQETETCPDAWVMILEGAPPSTTELPKVILPKTCSSNVNTNFPDFPDLNVTTTSNTSTIYFKNDGKGNFTVTRSLPLHPKPPPLSQPQCMWNCTWKENPFFSKVGYWRLGGWGDTKLYQPKICQDKDRRNCVKVYFSLPQMPSNLTCLEDCFDVVKEQIKREERGVLKCLGNDVITRNRTTSYDKNIDCLVVITKSKPKDNPDDNHNHLQENDVAEYKRRKNTKYENNGRKRREAETLVKQPDDLPILTESDSDSEMPIDTKEFHRLIATEALEMALVFCIMASLDARRKLPSLRYPTKEFYRGPQLWDGKVCSPFLPDFFESKEEGGKEEGRKEGRSTSSKTRLFGPGSSTVDRY